LNLSAGAKAAISEYFMDTGTLPTSNAAAGVDANITGNYVTGVAVGAAGRITVTYGNQANAAILADTLFLTPSTTSGSVVWACSAGGLLPKHVPSACR
jgi:type IV pilus assembly protein PilA